MVQSLWNRSQWPSQSPLHSRGQLKSWLTISSPHPPRLCTSLPWLFRGQGVHVAGVTPPRCSPRCLLIPVLSIGNAATPFSLNRSHLGQWSYLGREFYQPVSCRLPVCVCVHVFMQVSVHLCACDQGARGQLQVSSFLRFYLLLWVHNMIRHPISL